MHLSIRHQLKAVKVIGFIVIVGLDENIQDFHSPKMLHISVLKKSSIVRESLRRLEVLVLNVVSKVLFPILINFVRKFSFHLLSDCKNKVQKYKTENLVSIANRV